MTPGEVDLEATKHLTEDTQGSPILRPSQINEKTNSQAVLNTTDKTLFAPVHPSVECRWALSASSCKLNNSSTVTLLGVDRRTRTVAKSFLGFFRTPLRPGRAGHWGCGSNSGLREEQCRAGKKGR